LVSRADKVIKRSILPGSGTKQKEVWWIVLSVKNQILQVLSDSAVETKDNDTGKADTGRDRCLQPTGYVPV